MAEPRTAKELLVRLHYGDDLATLHPEDRQAVEGIVDDVEAAGWRIIKGDELALQGHISHGEVLVERDLLRDALTHVLAAARDVDRNMRSVVGDRCDDCDRVPGEGHDEDCGMAPLAAACDYAPRGVTGPNSGQLAPTSVGGSDA